MLGFRYLHFRKIPTALRFSQYKNRMETHEFLESVIPAFQQGDSGAFEAFFTAYYKPLALFADQFIGNMPEAEDIVKDSYVKLWNKREEFNHPKSIKGFLYTTTRNACLNYLRHLKVKDQYQKEILYLNKEEADDLVLRRMIHAELLESIYKEVDKLPEKRKQVFSMIYFEGMKLDEIAEQLGISIFTVKEHKARALAQLRLHFSDKQLMLFFFLVTGIHFKG